MKLNENDAVENSFTKEMKHGSNCIFTILKDK